MSRMWFTTELYDQIRELWQWYQRERHGGAGEGMPKQTPQKRPSVFRPLAVITDEAIGGSFFVPDSGLATLCDWDVETGERSQTEQQIEVFNENGESIAPDTPGIIIAVNGHWVIFPACEPLTDRPTPPWQGV